MHTRPHSLDLISVITPYVYPHQNVLLAFSGGVDSTVLLHLLVRLKASHALSVRALHIHHGLSTHADDWAKQVTQCCQQWHIPLEIIHVHLEGTHNVEARARDARYAALAKCVQPNEVILTGHHLDDQCETFLLALKRGSGPTGLAGMATISPFADTELIRPLLSVSRQAIEAYAQAHGLTWIDDDSNQDRRYDRNFLRLDILPQLVHRWPQFNAMVGRSAALCADESALLIELIANELASCLGTEQELKLPTLSTMSPPKRNAVLRAWLKQWNLPTPSRRQLALIWATVACAKQDACPQFTLGKQTIRRFQDALYVVTPQPPLVNSLLNWDMASPLRLPNTMGTLKCHSSPSGPLRKPRTNETVSVRFRGCGNVAIVGRPRTRSVKKLWQEKGVPPWQRDQIPLVYYNHTLVTAVGFFITREGQGNDIALTLEKDV